MAVISFRTKKQASFQNEGTALLSTEFPWQPVQLVTSYSIAMVTMTTPPLGFQPLDSCRQTSLEYWCNNPFLV